MILAVDAFNLAADRRGMGRYVRRILSGLRECGDIEIQLVVPHRGKARELAGEFSYPLLEPRDLRGASKTTVWYPWNGMRFAAPSRAVVTIHDPFAFTFPHASFWARRREQAPIRRALRSAGRLLAVSNWTKNELVRLFDIAPDRITIAPNAPDPFWKPVETRDGAPYFLFVAGAEQRKNAALLLRAFRAAFPAGEARLVVTGSLNQADAQTCARIPNAQFVQTDDAQLRELYSGATAVVVPSLAEGYGLTVIEAMACGAPVLAADAAALPETAAGAALLLPPTGEGAWRDAMETIARDAPLRQQLRERGLARAAAIDPDAGMKGLLEALRA